MPLSGRFLESSAPGPGVLVGSLLGLGGHYSRWVPPTCGLNTHWLRFTCVVSVLPCPAGIKVSYYRMSKIEPSEMFNRECFSAQTQSREVLEKDKRNPKTQDQPLTVSLYVTTCRLFFRIIGCYHDSSVCTLLFEGCSFSSLIYYDHLTHGYYRDLV